jgi:hypothetical protein
MKRGESARLAKMPVTFNSLMREGKTASVGANEQIGSSKIFEKKKIRIYRSILTLDRSPERLT